MYYEQIKSRQDSSKKKREGDKEKSNLLGNLVKHFCSKCHHLTSGNLSILWDQNFLPGLQCSK